MEDLPAAAAPPQVSAARGPFARRLALKLVDSTLGPVCQRVVQCLVDHGTQQFGDLVRAAGMGAPQLRAALLVLMQHNYVAAYLKEEPPTLRGAGPSYTLYEAALPRILQSLRVPRFLTHISDELGPESRSLVNLLVEHGRMRWDQLLAAAQSRAAAAAEGDDDDEGGGGGALPAADVLLNRFRSLVLERYVERVPPCTLPPPAHQVHPNARKRVSAPKPGSEEEAALHREQEEAAKRAVYQQARFTLPDELQEADAGDAGDKPGGKRKRGKDSAGDDPGSKKRGRKKSGEGSAAAAAGGDEGGGGEGGAAPALWRVNYEEFNRRFRNEVIVATVKSKHGPDEGAAAEGLLLANARFEQAAQAAETVVLSLSDVRSALRRKHGADGVPDNLGAALDTLADDELCLVEHRGQGPGGDQYVLDISRVLNLARLFDVQSVIRNKFGPHGMRIWNLLWQGGQLEQKQVAEGAMVPKEEARQKLYAMLRAGYLALQDVPRTADHAPSRTFYTWRANVDGAIARLTSDLYRAAGNLHARLAHEMDRKQELISLLQQPSSQVAEKVAERREGEVGTLKAVASRLEGALLEVDCQICLFADV